MGKESGTGYIIERISRFFVWIMWESGKGHYLNFILLIVWIFYLRTTGCHRVRKIPIAAGNSEPRDGFNDHVFFLGNRLSLLYPLASDPCCSANIPPHNCLEGAYP